MSAQEYRFSFYCVYCRKPVDPRGPTLCPECREKLKAAKQDPKTKEVSR